MSLSLHLSQILESSSEAVANFIHTCMRLKYRSPNWKWFSRSLMNNMSNAQWCPTLKIVYINFWSLIMPLFTEFNFIVNLNIGIFIWKKLFLNKSILGAIQSHLKMRRIFLWQGYLLDRFFILQTCLFLCMHCNYLDLFHTCLVLIGPFCLNDISKTPSSYCSFFPFQFSKRSPYYFSTKWSDWI